MKRIFSFLGLTLLMVLMTGLLTAAAPMPNITFTLVSGLPPVMNIGETYTVIVEVASDVPFNAVQAMPDLQYPGKGVVQVKGGDHAGSGTSARVEVTFTAKTDTSKMPDGKDIVSVVVGARYKGGYVAGEVFTFEVAVP
jgi:hypothetical protein